MSLMFGNTVAENDKAGYVKFDQAPEEAWVVLSGFQLGFDDGKDHNLKKVSVRITGVHLNSDEVSFNTNVSMWDDSDNLAEGKLYAMGIGQQAGDSTQFETLTVHPGDGRQTVIIRDQPTPIDQAWVYIQDLVVGYGTDTDHQVKTIDIAAGNEGSNRRKHSGQRWDLHLNVSFNPTIRMVDNSGNEEKDSESFLELVVMATPQTG